MFLTLDQLERLANLNREGVILGTTAFLLGCLALTGYMLAAAQTTQRL